MPPAVRTAHAPVAKLDKAPVYETGDYRFESCRVRHSLLNTVANLLIEDPAAGIQRNYR